MNEVIREVGIGVNRHWWIMLLNGILMILLGFLFVANPLQSVFALVWALGIFWIASGIMSVIYGVFGSYESGSSRAWGILGGILRLIAGFIVATYRLESGVTIPVFLAYVAGFTSIMSGIFEMIEGRDMRDPIKKHWSWGYFFSGLFSLLFGILLLTYPFIGAVSYVWVSGIFAIIGGFLSIVLSFRMKSALNTLREAT